MKKNLLLCLSIISITASSQTVGWFYSNPGSLDGYVLFAPNVSDTTYLIDKCGKRIHEWYSDYHPGLAVYLLNDGTLLRCCENPSALFPAGGHGGIIQKLDWNSNVIWSYVIGDFTQWQHHDAIQLPNGNIVAIVWESHTKTDAENNGRVSLGDYVWSEKLVEVQPVGNDSGIIVWQWRAWDHLIQDIDNTLLNYGVVADHPELININLGTLSDTNFDWLHVNGLDYDSALDQLMISCRNLEEVFIIDHSTTMAEAASHIGGNSGHGGDLLYRWGNPQNYNRGTPVDKKLYQQHNTTWIPQGMPGAGKIMVFNNGVNRPGTDYSTVETITPPAVVNYNYPIDPDSAYGPSAQDWVYTANPPSSLYSFVEGGAQRLENGNTFICDAISGRFIEIDSAGNDLWKYVNPVGVNGIVSQGQQAIQNTCFRATFIPSQYPGLAGQSLVPGDPIEMDPLNYTCTNLPTEVAELNFNDADITCYPNPFQNSFAFHVPAGVQHATLQIHDVTGRLLYEEQNFTATPQSDVLISLPQYKGMMFLSVKDDSDRSGANHIWKIVIMGL